MDEDKAMMHRKLSELWKSADIETVETAGKKYVIMSDSHIGDGGSADDLQYSRNKDTLLRALEHYRQNGFRLILLGDIEELWQFDLDEIVKTYENDVYAKLKGFGKNRIYRVYGNHDMDWCIRDPIKEKSRGDGWAVEALKMKDKAGNTSILLVHGHQGSKFAKKYAWISRIFVRRIWRPLEPLAVKLGLFGNPSSTKSQVVKEYERILYTWAKKNKVIIMCGHSHRAIYASQSYIDKLRNEIRAFQSDIVAHHDDKSRVKANIKRVEELTKKLASEKMQAREIEPFEQRGAPVPCYFNCGCTLFSDGMTVLEIENDMIRLVKWPRKPKPGRPYEIYDDGNGRTLSDFVLAVNK